MKHVRLKIEKYIKQRGQAYDKQQNEVLAFDLITAKSCVTALETISVISSPFLQFESQSTTIVNFWFGEIDYLN